MTELGNGGAARAIREAQAGPVLVSQESRPAAWIVSFDALAQVAATDSAEPGIYQQTLALLAVDLYQREVLTLGQAALLVGMALSDFIDLCGRLRVPVLWEPKGGIGTEVDALAATLEEIRTGN
ncbi:MAG: UPF0175 family protein [Dehalococcoidia bacterium]